MRQAIIIRLSFIRFTDLRIGVIQADYFLEKVDLLLLLFDSVDKDDEHVFVLHVLDFAFRVARDKQRLDLCDIFCAQAEVACAPFSPGESRRLQMPPASIR